MQTDAKRVIPVGLAHFALAYEMGDGSLQLRRDHERPQR